MSQEEGDRLPKWVVLERNEKRKGEKHENRCMAKSFQFRGRVVPLRRRKGIKRTKGKT